MEGKGIKMSRGKFLVASKLVLIRGNKLLILKRTDYEDLNKFSFDIPGGKLEENETPSNCLRREIEEELGIIVENPVLFDYKFFNSTPYPKIMLQFYTKTTENELKLSHEHDQHFWVGKDDLKDYPEWVGKTYLKLEALRVIK